MTSFVTTNLSTLGPTTLAVTWAECGLGTVAFALRIYTNGIITKRWKSDFWWCLTTYILALIATVFLSISVRFGLGNHLTALLANAPENIAKNQLHQWIFTTFAIVAISTGKLTIIAFILQIEGTTLHGLRKLILGVFAASNIIVNVIILPIIWTQCAPTAKMWNNSLPGNCAGRLRNQLYGYFQGSFGAFLDIAMALYPLFIFWNLKMQLHVKIGLIALFSFGIVAAVCAAIKTRELSTLTATSDITFQLASLDIWASTEMWVIFIVSCIPSIRPCFVRVFNIVYASGSNSRGTGHGYIQQSDTNTNLRGTDTNRSRAFTSATTTSKAMHSDNDSEENILPNQQGIMMTNQISVKYEENEMGKSKNWSHTHFEEV